MKIVNRDKVISKFGYWPKFCDAKIVNFFFDATTKKIGLTIDYIDVDKNKQSEVEFVFIGVFDVNLSDFFEENVLDELAFVKDDTNFYEIILDACYGLNGKFFCNSIQVI